jgi:hypothetical protein
MVYNQFDEPDNEPEPKPSDHDAWPNEQMDANIVPIPFDSPSDEETFRRSGLAWSAGIVLFGSVAFMLGLGWIADLILGSSPWGLVGGILLGSLIGFIQFFRISSQIFGSGKPENEIRPFLSREDLDDK